MKNFFIILFLIVGVEASSQQKIFITISGGDLYSIDIANCSKQLVGSTGIGFGDIAFTTNGILWGISNGQLYKIDTLDASTVLIGNTGIGPVSLVGLNDSILLAEFQMKLYGINTNTANSYFIGDIGYQADGDLVLIDKDLFMVTPLVKIELNSSFTEILNVSPINPSLPGCEGAAMLDNNNTSIIGFSGAGVIEICQSDGSYHIVCPNLLLNGAPGAASISNHIEESDLVNIFTPNGDGINDDFRPMGEPSHINSVVILNRWGDLVTKLSYPFVWDGTSKSGDNLSEGVYFYVLDKNEGCNNTIQKQSTIHLIR